MADVRPAAPQASQVVPQMQASFASVSEPSSMEGECAQMFWRGQHERLVGDLEALRQECTAREKHLVAVQESLAATDARVRDLDSVQETQTRAAKSFEAALKQLESRIHGFEIRITETESKFSDLETHGNSLQECVDHLERLTYESQDQHANQHSKGEAIAQDCSLIVQEHKAHSTHQNSCHEAHSLTHNANKERIANLEQTLEKLVSEYAENARGLDAQLQDPQSSSAEAFHHMQTCVESLQKDHEALAAAHTNFRERVELIEEDLRLRETQYPADPNARGLDTKLQDPRSSSAEAFHHMQTCVENLHKGQDALDAAHTSFRERVELIEEGLRHRATQCAAETSQPNYTTPDGKNGLSDVAAWFWAVRELLVNERSAREALEKNVHAHLLLGRGTQEGFGFRGDLGRSAVEDLCTRERLAAMQRTLETMNETMVRDRDDFSRELRSLWEMKTAPDYRSPASSLPAATLGPARIEIGTIRPLSTHLFSRLPESVFPKIGPGESISDVSTAGSVSASWSGRCSTPGIQLTPHAPPPPMSPPIAVRTLGPCRSPSPMQRFPARSESAERFRGCPA
jgi:exonuclease VII small subunit